MKKENNNRSGDGSAPDEADEMLDEYDFTGAERGEYAARYSAAVDVRLLAPDAPLGTASVEGERAVRMVTDGYCLEGTLQNLAAGHGAKPLSPSSITKAKRDALDFLGDILKVYDKEVAEGEVGADGTARAKATKPKSGRCPTALLYGRIQSGKTVAMIAFTAAAIDNGFRVVIVLTSDYVKLVEQTARRFGAIQGPLVKDSTRVDTWQPDATHVKEQIAEHGLVMICQKNQAHLASLVKVLQDVGAADYPALILDDEADSATLDTTQAARDAQKPKAPKHASTIHRKTVLNDAPWELGESIRERLPHHFFIQVTATPYALVLQRSNYVLRPSLARLLEPAEGYTGGEAFFSDKHLVKGGVAPLVFVDEHDSTALQDTHLAEAPPGLQQAIAFFLVSAGAQLIRDPGVRAQGQNFLCHSSHKKIDHTRVADLIRDYLSRVGEELKKPEPAGDVGVKLNWAYVELKKTMPDAPPFVEISEAIRRRLPRREIPIVNSANSPAEFGREMNFIVGGNILGRGLTIDNLLVTYYVRRAKGESQMDTVLQHARMFGYRGAIMPYTRVFLPEDLAFRFHGIHVAEQRLRAQLATTAATSKIIVETVPGFRATRKNVLPGEIAAYGPEEQVYPIAPALDRSALAKNPKIESALQKAMGGSLVASKFVDISTEQLVELIRLVPFPEEDAGNWDPDNLTKILESLADRYSHRAAVFYRRMERETRRLTTGAASGDEIKLAKERGVPVLFLFRDSGKHLGQEFWYPTLLLPKSMNLQLFNIA
jgi:hypothetical protein